MHIRMRAGGRAGATAVLALVAATSLAACGQDNAGNGGNKAGGADDLGDCGTLPEKAPSDAAGLLAELPTDVQAAYNGYPLKIEESTWKDFKPEGPGPYDVAIAYSTSNVPYQAALLDTVKSALESSDLVGEVTVNFSENDPALAVRNFQTLLNASPDIILTQPGSPDAFLPLIASAAEKGIPTVTLQSPIDTPDAVSVTPNPYTLGATPTAEVAKIMGGEGTMLGVHGVPGVPIESQIFQGIKDAVALCPDITLDDSVVGQFNPATAKTEVSKYLTTHPGEIGGVAHAAIMGPGILSAFEQSGKPVPPIADVAATEGVLAYMDAHSDYEAAGSAQGAASIGAVMADVTLRMLGGDGPELSQIVLPTPLITRDDLGDYEFGSDTTSAASVEPPQGTYPPAGFIDAVFGTN